MRCGICNALLKAHEGKFNPKTGTHDDLCEKCKIIILDSWVEDGLNPEDLSFYSETLEIVRETTSKVSIDEDLKDL